MTSTTPTEPEALAAAYLIRKGGAYYRPKAEGYTRDRLEAGRFTLEEAISHSHPNGPDGPRDGITYEADEGGFIVGTHAREVHEDSCEAMQRPRADCTCAAPLSTPAARMPAGEGAAVAWMYDYRLKFRGDDSDWKVGCVSALKPTNIRHHEPDYRNIVPLYAHPPAAEPVGLRELLDRAELAWQRFFYPAADNFTGPIGDKLPSVDLEVADCLRLVLAAMGRHVVTPSKDIPAVKPLRDAQVKTVAEKLAAFTGAPYEDWRHFTVEAGHIIDRLSALATPARTDDAGVGQSVANLRRKYQSRATDSSIGRKERTRCSHYLQVLDEITAALSPAPDDAGPYSASDVSVNSLSSAPDRVAAGSRSLNVADSRERPAPIAALKPADAIPVWDAVQMAEAGALRIGWWNYMRARGVSQDDAIAKINAALQSKERKA